jgi:hypothetical protein
MPIMFSEDICSVLVKLNERSFQHWLQSILGLRRRFVIQSYSEHICSNAESNEWCLYII